VLPDDGVLCALAQKPRSRHFDIGPSGRSVLGLGHPEFCRTLLGLTASWPILLKNSLLAVMGPLS